MLYVRIYTGALARTYIHTFVYTCIYIYIRTCDREYESELVRPRTIILSININNIINININISIQHITEVPQASENEDSEY
jgi:hypothetical protein